MWCSQFARRTLKLQALSASRVKHTCRLESAAAFLDPATVLTLLALECSCSSVHSRPDVVSKLLLGHQLAAGSSPDLPISSKAVPALALMDMPLRKAGWSRKLLLTVRALADVMVKHRIVQCCPCEACGKCRMWRAETIIIRMTRTSGPFASLRPT